MKARWLLTAWLALTGVPAGALPVPVLPHPASAKASAAKVSLERARHSLEWRREEEAARWALAGLALARTPAERFECQAMRLHALFAGLRVQEAWKLLWQLEKLDRHEFPPSTLLDFYLTRGRMLARASEPALSERNLEEARRCAEGTPRLVEVELALLQSVDQDEKKASACLQRLAQCSLSGSLGDYWQGRVALALSEQLRSQAQTEAGLLTLALARGALARSGSGYWRAQVELTRLRSQSEPPDWPAESERMLGWLSDPRDATAMVRVINSICNQARASASFKVLKPRLLQRLRDLERRQSDPRLCMFSRHVRTSYLQTSEQALEEIRTRLTDARLPPAARLDLSTTAGGLCLTRRDFAQGMQYLDQAQILADQLDPQPGDEILMSPAMLRFMRSTLLQNLGQTARVREELELLVRTATEAKDRYPKVLAIATLANLDAERYHLEEAYSNFQKGIQLAEQFTIPRLKAASYSVMLAILLGEKGVSPLLESIRDDPKLVEQALSACEHWAKLEERAQRREAQGLAHFFKGLLLSSLQRRTEAIEALRQANEWLAIARDPTQHLGMISQLLAQNLFDEGQKEEAVAVLQRAERALIGAPQLTDPLSCSDNLADMLRRCERLHEAMQVAERTLQQRRKLGTAYPTLLTLARIHIDSKQPRLAEAELREAQAEGSKLGLPYQATVLPLLAQAVADPEEAFSLQEKAAAHQLARGRLGSLPKLFLEELDLWEKAGRPERAHRAGSSALARLAELSSQLDPRERAAWLKSAELHKLVDRTVALCLGQHESTPAQQAISFWRGLEQSALGPENADLHQRREQLAELRDRLGRAPASQSQQLESLLAQARRDLLTQLTDLRQRNPDFESLVTTDPSELLGLQAHLAPDDTVVQLYPGEDTLSFQIIRRDSVTFRQQRISRPRLFELIQRVRSAVSRPEGDPRAALQELSNQLIAPLQADLPERGNLWLLPTSELWYVPWEALRRGSRPVGDSLVVTCLSSQDLSGLTRPPLRPGGPALVVGAPDQRDLPGSWVEARDVAAQVQGQLLLGPEASKARLMELSHGARMLHLATHSTVRPGNLASSSFVLSGGNLELREIFGLQLAPGALVVLSSCQSGLAQDHPGREVTSLAYAFHAAGATSVVSTLWPIDDQAQSQLIPTFYKSLAGGMSRAQALSEAKRSLRSQPATAHPYYWAGLYLLGDPR